MVWPAEEQSGQQSEAERRLACLGAECRLSSWAMLHVLGYSKK